jgi:hypothetical protein
MTHGDELRLILASLGVIQVQAERLRSLTGRVPDSLQHQLARDLTLQVVNLAEQLGAEIDRYESGKILPS